MHLTVALLFLVVGACSSDQRPARSPLPNPSASGLPEKTGEAMQLTRSFTALPLGKLESEHNNIAAIHLSSADVFALMKKDGTSYIFDQRSNSFVTVTPVVKYPEMVATFTLADRHVWYLTPKAVGRSSGDINKANVEGLSLALPFPAAGPKILGVGISWIVLYWEGNAYIVSMEAARLSAAKILMPESLFGANGPIAAGKAADEKTPWFLSEDSIQLLLPAEGKTGSAWVKTGEKFDYGESIELKGIAMAVNVQDRRPKVEGHILVMSEKSFFFSSGVDSGLSPETPAAKPNDGKTPTPAGTAGLSFAKDIKPLNDKYCISCHAAGSSSGDYSTEATWLGDKDNIIARVEIAKKGQAGVMPTAAFAAQPTDAERTTMATFLKGPAPTATPKPSGSPSPSPSPSPVAQAAIIAALNTDGNASCGQGNAGCHATFAATVNFADWIKLVATRKGVAATRMNNAAMPMPPGALLQDPIKTRMINNLNSLQ